MPSEVAGRHHGHGKNDRLAPQHMSPRIIVQTLPCLTELGEGKSKVKGRESPALLSPIEKGRENTSIPPFSPIDNVSISNRNYNESQLTSPPAEYSTIS